MARNSKKKPGPAADHYDILIIGGGINGAGIARDAAGRGYSVCLCDAGDFGGGTSSASTKLVHGGLRYLEHYEFRLVRESLMEREILWQMAPHIIWPLRFILPYHSGLRPAWMLRLGLFLYDNLGGRKLLPGTKTLDLKKDPAGTPLKSPFVKGFEYSDCWVEDSRLVILNLRDAVAKGADVKPRTAVENARHESG
ncbi:MAG: FAD-dependent oxidoreductase, partial [Rhizobiaceae bacterium]